MCKHHHVLSEVSEVWFLKMSGEGGGRSDRINIPEPLLFKIIIGHSGSPTGRKMKLSVGRDEHSGGLTDGQTDEREGRQVRNTLELWPHADTHQCYTLKEEGGEKHS